MLIQNEARRFGIVRNGSTVRRLDAPTACREDQL